MNRDELKGKQTPGEAIANGGTVYINGASCVYTESPAREWLQEEAMAVLYAEAHNAANRTGLWPEDMEARIKELEDALRNLYESVDSCTELTPQLLLETNAILNKTP